ncbi:YadA-like family protein [Escherichia coli]|nr:YadA-like family protein [Escherichia coli]MCE2442855.1 YadA-like family protein [Escherichia coli]
MNKIFKVIWNPATGSYTVASETAKSRGKKSGRSKLLISALVAGGLLSSFGAYAEVSLDGGTSAETTPLTNGWIAIGHDSIASSVVQSGAAAAIGYQARALGEGSTALGYQSLATGDRAMALGQMSKSSGNRAAALGSGANAAGDHSLALGGATNAQGEYSVAIGRAATTDSNYALSMGYMAKANGLYSLAMGAGSATSNDNAIAIGNKTQALGVNSTALGNASQASGESSIALGSTSEASEQNAIALGQGSIASKVNSIALGSNSLSSGENAIALGEGSAAGGSNSLAFGSQSRANGNDSVAIGVGAAAATDNSVAIGAGSTTDASNTVSVGNSATKRKIVNMAAGAISNTSTDAINGSQLYTISDSVAKRLGGGATVGSDGTVTAVSYALRSGTYNNVGDALSGIDNNTLQWNKTAGAFSANHGANATNKITNVAKGTVSATTTDASAAGIGSTAVGYNTVAKGDSSVAMGYNSFAKGDSSVAIGQGSYSGVDTGIALGSSSVSSRVIVKGSRNTSVSEEGVVIGYDTTDGELLGALSIGDDGKYRQIINVADGSEAHDAVTVRQLQNAIGAVATTPTKYYHANSTAEDSLAVGEDSLAMGAKTIVNGNAGIGIGLNTLVLADAINGIAIGSNARANHADSIAMGNGSQTTRGAQTNYTAYNMDAPQNSVGEFSVGSEDGQRQITNVAAGSADTDAVNVGQLKVTDAQVSQNTQSITNLNTQVTNLDTRVTNIENGIGDIVTTGSTKYFKTNTDGADANAQGKDSVAIGSGSIAAADNSVALGTGSVADEENTISVGSSTNQRRITNVAAGVNATDAVNVSQLKSSEAGGVRYDTKADGSIDYSNITLGGGNSGTTRISNVSAGVNNNDAVNYAQLKQSVQETKQYTDQRMVEMDNKLSKTESKLSGGIASAMAMTGLPQAYTPGASMASIGGGTYNGESAVALGVSMVSANGRWVYKLQGSTNSQGEYSAALGAGIQW